MQKNQKNRNQTTASTDWRPLLDTIFQGWMDAHVCSEFLSALIGRKVRVTAVETQKTIFELNPEKRRVYLDVYAPERRIAIFNLEAQMKHEGPAHKPRVIFHAGRVISTQLKKGESFDQLKDTYVIFVNKYNPDAKRFTESCSLRDDVDCSVYSDKLRIFEVNLHLIDKVAEDPAVDPRLKVFGYFCLAGHLKGAFRSLLKKAGAAKHPLAQALLSRLDNVKGKAAADDDYADRIDSDRRDNVDVKEEYPMDVLTKLYEEGMEKGIEKGMEKGIEKGIEKGLEKAAKNMLAMGMKPEQVVQGTGLPLSQVMELKPAS